MVWRAEKTLAAIHEGICRDGGNTYRRNFGQVLPHLGDAYRDDEDGRRSHLGASVIGGQCERATFYSFRWASAIKVRGKKGEDPAAAESRMRRLWNRGHLEEGRFIAILLTAGIAVYQQDHNGNQYRITALGGHFSGSGDGVVVGIPDLPAGVMALLELKTHSEDSFEKLSTDGVQLSKPEHYWQMQTYMHHMGLEYAIYLAVNKNNDALWAEVVVYNQAIAEAAIERANRLIFGSTPPRMRGASPSFYVCKYMCDHYDVCYRTVQPQRNCRTCKFVRFEPNGTVVCVSPVMQALAERQGWEEPIALSKEDQLKGCEHYEKDEKLQ